MHFELGPFLADSILIALQRNFKFCLETVRVCIAFSTIFHGVTSRYTNEFPTIDEEEFYERTNAYKYMYYMMFSLIINKRLLQDS